MLAGIVLLHREQVADASAASAGWSVSSVMKSSVSWAGLVRLSRSSSGLRGVGSWSQGGEIMETAGPARCHFPACRFTRLFSCGEAACARLIRDLLSTRD